MPKRNTKKEFFFSDHPEFTPNLSPKEMFSYGIFGGTYFRKIHSSILHKDIDNAWKEFPQSWFKKYPVNLSKEDLSINKYKVHSGTSLKFWESSGWIKSQDPFGWLQWYCRFFQGRRSPDDTRQIKRWLGVAHGRFRNRLINLCIKQNKKYNDPSVSPVIRQLLLQWAYQLTSHDLKNNSI